VPASLHFDVLGGLDSSDMDESMGRHVGGLGGSSDPFADTTPSSDSLLTSMPSLSIRNDTTLLGAGQLQVEDYLADDYRTDRMDLSTTGSQSQHSSSAFPFS
jgi:hypothetical protein